MVKKFIASRSSKFQDLVGTTTEADAFSYSICMSSNILTDVSLSLKTYNTIKMIRTEKMTNVLLTGKPSFL